MNVFGPRVWANPLFVKSVRSRLRPRAAAFAALVALSISLFIYMVSFVAASKHTGASAEEAAGATLRALLAFQGVLLFFLGTGAAAHGTATERERGLVDYQRLTPMVGIDKVLGYLFGLPVREYFMYALTVPFVLLTTVAGGLSLARVLTLYAVFHAIVVVYHLTGLTAGMVAKRPVLAGWTARIGVVVLYFGLPVMTAVGFTLFAQLTIMPTQAYLIAGEFGRPGDFTDQMRQPVPFFFVDVPPPLYSLVLQGLLITLLVTMLLRKWRDDRAHSLSKVQALAAFSVLQVLILGSLSPLLQEPWKLRAFAAVLAEGTYPEALAGVLSVYLFLSLLAGTVLLNIVTSDPNGLREGLRRARKQGKTRVSVRADKSSSVWVTLAFGTITAACYFAFVNMARATGVFGPLPFSPALALPPLLIAATLLGIQGIRQHWGGKGLGAAVFLLGILPLMVMIVLGAAFDAEDAATYFGLLSPPIAIVVAMLHAMGIVFTGGGESFADEAWGALVVHCIIAAAAFRLQWRSHRSARASAFRDPEPSAAPPRAA
jgi:hypothetical protein